MIMATSMSWPVFGSGESPLEMLVKLSNYYGSDPEYVIAGGGNTSVKMSDETMYVKGSGYALATIGPEGFVEMDRRALQELLGRDLGSDRNRREELFKQAVMAARRAPEKGQRPSVEVVFHHLMPRRFVVHTHATLVNMYTCCTEGARLIDELLGDEAIWIPEVDPGLPLAQAIRDALAAYAKRTGRDCPRAVIMQNHGVIVCGDDPEEVRSHMDWLMGRLRAYLESRPAGEPFGAIKRLGYAQARGLINIVGPALRGLLAENAAWLKVVMFDDSPEAVALACGAAGRAAAEGGPLMPDQIVYCKALPLWFEVRAEEDAAALVSRLRQAVEQHRRQTQFAPHVVLVEGLGMFAAGDDYAAANAARLVYLDAIKVMAGALRLGGKIHYLSPEQREFFEYWEVEAYRRKVARATIRPGRAAGKVAVVTGAAQGFGLEIACDLAAQGAHVVLGDINIEGARRAADELARRWGEGRALAVPMNVADAASVQESIDRVVRTYGGLDVLICNAGVLRAGSVKTQSERDFDFVTAVNYKGYFLCVQKAAPLMAVQHMACPGYWSDIIQINSKSGLEGSNRNGAYAGSKFGGIGLTQSFALELVEDGIKVNAICPGNFFDGPLWSDPENGLFVQYLRSGKVPGAKTVADVRRAYEQKIPMGRGCTTADVMKAIYYVMEQQYETGQAIPVTGGQVMLR